jgi:hypothetical protein
MNGRLLAGGLFFLALFVPAAADQEARPSENVLRGPGVFELPSGRATDLVLEQVLQSAGVLYGLEAAPPSAEPLVDFGRPPDRAIALDGFTVGEALDTIVREDPRYEWEEVEGRILVRAAAARTVGVLDARVPRFAVEDATYADALGALVRAILPDEPQPRTTRAGATLEAEPAVEREPAAEARRVTLNLQNVTVLEILEALARAHGALSWRVSYDAFGMGPEHASIALSTVGTSVAVLSRRWERETTAARDRLLVPVFESLNLMLSAYAGRRQVQFGLESLPDPPGRLTGGGAQLDLTDLSPTVAIARIVELDSRFDWAEAGGIFNVRPRPAYAPRRSLLDRTFDTLTFEEVTAEGALDRLAELLGEGKSGRGYGEGGRYGVVDRREQRRLIAAGRAKTISLTLRDVTLRDVLNALCRAHGTLSWDVRPLPNPPGIHIYTMRLSSYDGWSVSRSINLSHGDPQR